MKPSELLAEPGRWAKRVLARTSSRFKTGPLSVSAFSFCIIGACIRCNIFSESLEPIIKARGFKSVAGFNDHPSTTHENVLSVLQEAGL